MEWLTANLGTIFVLVFVLAAAGLAVRSLRKSRKQGKCAGGCAGCSGCCGSQRPGKERDKVLTRTEGITGKKACSECFQVPEASRVQADTGEADTGRIPGIFPRSIPASRGFSRILPRREGRRPAPGAARISQKNRRLHRSVPHWKGTLRCLFSGRKQIRGTGDSEKVSSRDAAQKQRDMPL